MAAIKGIPMTLLILSVIEIVIMIIYTCYIVSLIKRDESGKSSIKGARGNEVGQQSDGYDDKEWTRDELLSGIYQESLLDSYIGSGVISITSSLTLILLVLRRSMVGLIVYIVIAVLGLLVTLFKLVFVRGQDTRSEGFFGFILFAIQILTIILSVCFCVQIHKYRKSSAYLLKKKKLQVYATSDSVQETRLWSVVYE